MKKQLYLLAVLLLGLDCKLVRTAETTDHFEKVTAARLSPPVTIVGGMCCVGSVIAIGGAVTGLGTVCMGDHRTFETLPYEPTVAKHESRAEPISWEDLPPCTEKILQKHITCVENRYTLVSGYGWKNRRSSEVPREWLR